MPSDGRVCSCRAVTTCSRAVDLNGQPREFLCFWCYACTLFADGLSKLGGRPSSLIPPSFKDCLGNEAVRHAAIVVVEDYLLHGTTMRTSPRALGQTIWALVALIMTCGLLATATMQISNASFLIDPCLGGALEPDCILVGWGVGCVFSWHCLGTAGSPPQGRRIAQAHGAQVPASCSSACTDMAFAGPGVSYKTD